MKERKSDQRSKYTQSTIEDALVKLLSEKQLKDITISELCSAASVCRGTFYNQYCDIYDVYESIEQKSYASITEKLNEHKLYSLEISFFREIMYLVLRNKDWFSVIFSNIENSKLVKRIIDYIKEKYITEYSEKYPKLSTRFIAQVFTYATNGSIAILTEWIKSGAVESPESIAELISKLNNTIMQKMLN